MPVVSAGSSAILPPISKLWDEKLVSIARRESREEDLLGRELRWREVLRAKYLRDMVGAVWAPLRSQGHWLRANTRHIRNCQVPHCRVK